MFNPIITPSQTAVMFAAGSANKIGATMGTTTSAISIKSRKNPRINITAITITNLRTGGHKVVPFSFITSINLDRLTDIDYGIPDLFDRVRKLNHLNRNWSQPGNIKRDINIVDEHTFCGDSPISDGDTNSPLDQGCSEEEEMNLQDEEDEAEQNMQHDPSQGTSDPVQWSHEPEVLPDEEHSIPHHHGTDTHRETVHSSSGEDTSQQETENKRYGLRKRTVKKQYVYSIKTLKAPDYWYNLRKETVNDFREETVNQQEQRQYAVHALKTPVYNQETEYLECSDRDTFYARKRAWRTHFSVCDTRPCKECDGWLRVRNARWTPNEREYAECLIEVDKINVEKRKPTKIRFSEEPVKVKIVKRYLKVDIYTLSLATKFCTSLKEVLGMTQYLP